MKKVFSFRAVFVVMLSIVVGKAGAQSNVQELSKIILERDSLFWVSYNNCDSTKNGLYLTDDLEFYHDKGGITLGKKALVASLVNNLCSRPGWHLRREAVPGTVKVFELTNNGVIYGAMLVGEHYFYITENGQAERRTGHASFTHLWTKDKGEWKMSRLFSYDHHAAAEENKRKKKVTGLQVRENGLVAEELTLVK